MQPLTLENAPDRNFPQAPLGGLDVVMMAPGVCVALPDARGCVVSLAVAVDLRGECVVEWTDGRGWSFQLDAGYASHAQRLRVLVPAGVKEIYVERVEGEAELWIAKQAPLAPVAVEAEASLEERRRRALTSLRDYSLCQFSWMGGCVLDGLCALAQADPTGGWDAALDAWMEYFWRDGSLIYQSPRGAEVRDAFHGIESTLPVAVIARRDPGSALVEYALKEWRRMRRADDLVTDHSITAEGCYTAAYPMAVIGQLRGDEALIELALTQLRIRRDKLCIGGDLYLRNLDGQLSFRNWTRGICWSLLGLARTLQALDADRGADLREFAAERAAWIMARQREDGLWDNFLDEAGQGLPPDSSGSAGIATALMIFHQLGIADKAAVGSARSCWNGLGHCLEPDGLLGSVAPNNKRGETEQHTTRRTIEPFALGLYGQLAAALGTF